jgi:thiol-disulfide isomerase/thioredoxin
VFAGIAATVLILLFGAAIFVGRLEQEPAVTNAVNRGTDATAPVIYAASIPDLQGRPQTIGQWSQQLLVLNFWASWCAPCLEEIPMLVKVQEKYGARGLQIVGIAADSPLNSSNFVKKLNINYPVLADEAGAIAFSKRVGNRFGLLPFTIIVSPKGEILLAKLGVLSEAELVAIVEKASTKS